MNVGVSVIILSVAIYNALIAVWGLRLARKRAFGGLFSPWAMVNWGQLVFGSASMLHFVWSGGWYGLDIPPYDSLVIAASMWLATTIGFNALLYLDMRRRERSAPQYLADQSMLPHRARREVGTVMLFFLIALVLSLGNRPSLVGVYTGAVAQNDYFNLMRDWLIPGAGVAWYLVGQARLAWPTKVLYLLFVLMSAYLLLVSGIRNRLLALFVIAAGLSTRGRRFSPVVKRGLVYVGTALVAIVIGGVVGTLRSGTYQGVTAGILMFDYLDTYFNSAVIVDYVHTTGHFLLGHSLYTLVVNPIPRAVWPEKPVGFGAVLAHYYRTGTFDPRLSEAELLSGWSVAPSAVGEAYANFGPFAPLFVGVGLWMLARWAERLVRQRSPSREVAYYLLAFQAFMLVRGDLLSMAAFTAARLLPCFVAWIGSKARWGKRSSSHFIENATRAGRHQTRGECRSLA